MGPKQCCGDQILRDTCPEDGGNDRNKNNKNKNNNKNRQNGRGFEEFLE